jgi:DNA-binding transcriptional MerR regulator
MKRGGGRRFYRPDDLDLLRGIRHLLYGEGYTIRGVQRILREQGIKFVQVVWQEGAVQPPHGATEEEDLVDEAMEPEVEETDDDRPGIGSRLGALIGRDLSDRDEVEPRREPPMTAAPMPRLTNGDRAIHAAIEPAVEVEDEAPVPVKAVAAAGGAARTGLGAEDLATLREVLSALGECRRLIDAAVARPD